jgi:threonylcarbamoyladenosine tRNA methylthiotransferase MtaB
VFSYSERKNTHAVTLTGAVDIAERKRRSFVLRSLSNKKRLEFYRKNNGKMHRILFESVREDNIFGFTENYIKVKSAGKPEFENQIMNSKIKFVESFSFTEAEAVSN